jgi:hypothetical protein
VLTPNAALRVAVTALAEASVADSGGALAKTPPQDTAEAPVTRNDPEPTPAPASWSFARDLWALRLARLDEVFPLTGPIGGASMCRIAFITDPSSIERLLVNIGEPSTPPLITPARGPPEWDWDEAPGRDDQDLLVEPEPEFEYDPRISW